MHSTTGGSRQPQRFYILLQDRGLPQICYKVYNNRSLQLLGLIILEHLRHQSFCVEFLPYTLLLALLVAHSMITSLVYGQLTSRYSMWHTPCTSLLVIADFLVAAVFAQTHNNVVEILLLPCYWDYIPLTTFNITTKLLLYNLTFAVVASEVWHCCVLS